MLDYSKGYVKNLYEKPVTDSQFEARALIKAFTVTASWAKKLYGVSSINSTNYFLLIN